MRVVLYTYTGRVNDVNKSLTQKLAVDGQLRGPTSVISPSLDIQGASAQVLGSNYAYIPDFNRYYFFTIPPDAVTENVWRLSLRVDVLMSFRTEILRCVGIVRKSEFTYNAFLDFGEDYYAQVNPKEQVKEFPNGFSNPCFVIALAGNSTTT